jgi:hypothetical protein
VIAAKEDATVRWREANKRCERKTMCEQVVMKVIKLFIALVLLQSLFLAVELQAGDAPTPTPYAGDIWTRSTLTGDWGALRNELAAKGVTLDMNITRSGKAWSVAAKTAHGSTAGAATLSSI